MTTIPTITLPPTNRETTWVSVDDLRFFVQELEQIPSSPGHQAALDLLRQVCGLTKED